MLQRINEARTQIIRLLECKKKQDNAMFQSLTSLFSFLCRDVSKNLPFSVLLNCFYLLFVKLTKTLNSTLVLTASKNWNNSLELTRERSVSRT